MFIIHFYYLIILYLVIMFENFTILSVLFCYLYLFLPIIYFNFDLFYHYLIMKVSIMHQKSLYLILNFLKHSFYFSYYFENFLLYLKNFSSFFYYMMKNFNFFLNFFNFFFIFPCCCSNYLC